MTHDSVTKNPRSAQTTCSPQTREMKETSVNLVTERFELVNYHSSFNPWRFQVCKTSSETKKVSFILMTSSQHKVCGPAEETATHVQWVYNHSNDIYMYSIWVTANINILKHAHIHVGAKHCYI